jgi:hypothetical protein
MYSKPSPNLGLLMRFRMYAVENNEIFVKRDLLIVDKCNGYSFKCHSSWKD